MQELTAAAVRRRLESAQRELRLPTLSAAVAGAGDEPLLVGLGDPPPGPDVQYRIGSISKTFTAVLVFQERDAGRLSLDDTLGRHVDGLPVGHLRLRDLLAHRSGLRTEPPAPFWEAAPGRSAADLRAGLDRDDVVLPPGRAWHYSNLGYALLGLVVEHLAGAPFADVLAERVLRPLGLTRTTWLPAPPAAPGLRLRPFRDELVAEPTPDTGVMGPAGQLWSTPADLCRWGAFLAAGHDDVLARATLDEMAEPVAVADLEGWTEAAGLGLQLHRSGERVYAGHGGSMPGFTAGLLVDRRRGHVAAACGNLWRAATLTDLARDLLDEVASAAAEPGWATASTPAAVADLLGWWWWRDLAFVATATPDGVVLARHDDPADRDHFAGDGDRFVCVEGDSRGERLTVVRDRGGGVTALDLGGRVFTRDPSEP